MDTSEQGQTTDTYTIALKTVPTGAVNVQIAASDGQTQISRDGINFSNTLNLSLTNRTPVTITVRPVEDSNFETSPHTGTITHAIISSADPAYSNALTPIANVTVNITDNDIAIVSKLRANFSEVFGPDKVTRLDSQVNYDWGYSTPDPLIGNDYFVGQWSGLIQAPVTGQYTLFTNSDDGVRLYFEDQLVVDELREGNIGERAATVQMEAGKFYRVRLQYLEASGWANARLSWQPPGGTKQVIPEANLFSLNNSASAGSGTGLRGIYYDNRDFTGTTIGRTDSRVAFDWGGGSPDAAIAPDDFSVRWEGKISPQYTEKYSFHTIADDGVRLWVNGQLLIDDWNYHGYQIKNSGSIDLVAGQKYDIKLEYFEGGAGAGVSLMWSSYSQGFEVIPTSQLSWSNNNVTLAVAPATVNEGGTTNLVYTFTRTGDLTDPLTVNFNVGGSATFGTDYTQTGAFSFSGANGTITFAANSSTATVTITPTADSLVEPDETVELTLTSPTNYTIGTTTAVLGTLTDKGPAVNKLKANFSEVFGPDKVTRLDNQINFEWGGGSPDPLIGSDYFVAQWSGLIQAPVTGQYTLFTNSDDGVRLYFEDQLVVDELREGNIGERSATVQMEAGKFYRVRLQYLEASGGANARLSWQPPGGTKQVIPEANLFSLNNSASAGSGTGLRATYYDNGNFTGTTVNRTDSRVAFDWGGGAPDPLLGGDDFSVRWEGKVEAQYTEKYSFHTIADDGVRLWVNNQLVIDDWNYHGYQIKNSGSIDLVAGQKYDIKLEYFEGGGGAGVSMMWSSYNQGFEVVPTSQLFPN